MNSETTLAEVGWMTPPVSPSLQWEWFLQCREWKVLWYLSLLTHSLLKCILCSVYLGKESTFFMCFTHVLLGFNKLSGWEYIAALHRKFGFISRHLFKTTARRETVGMFSLSQNLWVLQANNKRAGLRFYAKIQWCNAIMRELAAYWLLVPFFHRSSSKFQFLWLD